jgi:hypothetical protein
LRPQQRSSRLPGLLLPGPALLWLTALALAVAAQLTVAALHLLPALRRVVL